MSLQAVKESLYETRLNFDSTMANDVCLFFTQNGIQFPEFKVFLHSVAAASIISEERIALSKESQQNLLNPITFEVVMNRIRHNSKEQFIELLLFMVDKNLALQQKLQKKIINLNTSFRLFKKYRKIFEELWKHTSIHELVMNELLSIFWLVFLLFKYRKPEHFEDFNQQVKLLIVVIKSIFQYWVSCIPKAIVDEQIEKQFDQKVQNLIDEQFFLLHHAQLSNQTQKIYEMKHNNQSMDFKRFSKNPIKIFNFLSDIALFFCNFRYQMKKKNKVFDNQIDEISFLNLQAMNLSLHYETKPKIIEKVVEKNAPQINFVDQKISQEVSQKQNDRKQNRAEPRIPMPKQMSHVIIAENLPRMTPLRDRKENSGVTPCHSRMVNLEWIRNCLYFMCRPDTTQIFNRAFNFVQKQSLIDFEFKARKQLFCLVQEFSPKCFRKENRVNDMLAFFKYIIIKIYQEHDYDSNAKMFKQVKTFNSILCLSCDIFNYVYNSAMSSYRRVCEIFEIPLVEALKPINWIGKKIQKPSEINNYLYALEKRIVIKEIWEDETGYNLLKSQQAFSQSSSIEYPDFIVWGRLIKHILDRVQEFSKQIKLQSKQIKRVKALIDTILKQKPSLLYKNKIDQIIICCMTSFLTINQIVEKNALEKVFSSYNRIDLSENQNRNGLTSDGREMTLSQFYNEAFLPQIQEIVQKNNTQTDFLETPIRQHYRLKATSHLGLTTPFAKKYPQNQIDQGQNFRPVQLSSPGIKLEGLSFIRSPNPLISSQNYRAKIIAQKPQMEEQDQDEDDDEQGVSKSKNQNSSERMSQRLDQSDEPESSGQEKSQKLENSELEGSESSNKVKSEEDGERGKRRKF